MIDAHQFFDDKVAGVCASTAAAPPPTCTAAPPGCSLSTFRAFTADDVIAAIPRLPDKHCATDPISTRLLMDIVNLLAPFITELFNRSLSSGVFPAPFKSAYITPLL